MNSLIVVGLVVIAVGSVLGGILTFIGARRQSRTDSAQVEAKLEEIRIEIQAAKSQPAITPAQSEQIDSIDRDFRAWAADFAKNKERTRLEADESWIGDVKRKLDQSSQVRPVYELYLNTLRLSIAAYNEETGSHFLVDIPRLPLDMFKDAATYSGRITFGNKARWAITLEVGDLPFLQLKFYDVLPSDVPSEPYGSVSVAVQTVLDPVVSIRFSGERLPKLPGIIVGYPLLRRNEYQAPVQLSAKQLVKAQIVAIEH